MSKKQELQFESNNSVEELNGFVPVQYKMLKLDAKYILNSEKKNVDEKNKKGIVEKVEYYSVPATELLDWLIFSHDKSGLVSVGDNILFQKIREVKAQMQEHNTSVDVEDEAYIDMETTPNEQQRRACKILADYRAELKRLKRLLTMKPTKSRKENYDKQIMKIEKFLYIPEVINVQGNKGEYDKFAEKGFFYGGAKFVRLCASSGSLKQNTVTFIREDIYKLVLPKIRVGFQLNIETSEILAPSKFGAYEGLIMSGCTFVSTPNVVVIPDFEYITFKDRDNREHCVYYVTKEERKEVTEDGKEIKLPPIYHPDNIVPFFETKKDKDGNFCAYLNSFDGMGFIEPNYVKEKWQQELQIDYIPAAFNVRSIGVKGLLVTFPFREFARRKGYTQIYDIRYKDCPEDEAKYVDIDKVDVILTESQWKYKKLYADIQGRLGYNFDYYNNNAEALWGVQRYAPKVDKDISRFNYQLVQTSNIRKDEDVERVVDPTKKYLRILANGEKEHIMYALLKETMRKVKESDSSLQEADDTEDIEIEDMESETDSTPIEYEELRTSTLNRAIYKNHNLLQDVYVSNQMKKMIKGILDKAKCGKLYPEHNSNYQFMISDPYALAQWAFNWFDWKLNGTQGRENRVIKHIPTTQKEEMVSGFGLIPANHVYSNYWLQKNVSVIDACRSPMTDIAEHNILNICNTENTPVDVFDEMEIYYKYITSGIIFSVHDLSTVRASDSDFDSDMVCTFDSDVFIENAWDVIPTTYDKGVDDMKPQKYSIQESIKSDKQGFGNQVGIFSNYSTSVFAMIPMFNDGERHTNELYPEYDCTEKQLALYNTGKTLRFLNGEEIDSTKTGVKPEKSEDFVFTKPDKDAVKRANQKEIEKLAKEFLSVNELVPKYMPYFFIYAKPSYHDRYSKYKMRLNDTCKWYTFESVENFIGAVMRGERELITDDEKAFWKYFTSNCPLLLSDCLMNKVCWNLESFEKELNNIIKEKWQNGEEKYVLLSYAKSVELNKKQKKFIKDKYNEYRDEIKAMYNKKNVKETNDPYQISRREALIFRIRMELIEELEVGFTDLFNMLVGALSSESKDKVNGFIWNIMGEDILDVIPYSEEYLEWNDTVEEGQKYDVEILGRKVQFRWRKRDIDKE